MNNALWSYPGAALERLSTRASSELVLAAPFVKEWVLRRLLNNVSASVRVRCVTRWRPEEIAAGVSDLEVWDVVKSRENAELFLRPDLHAKYFRGDRECLVGSANLTQRALGWTESANFEVLVPLTADDPSLKGFEECLFDGTTAVDEELAGRLGEAVRLLPARSLVLTFAEGGPAEMLGDSAARVHAPSSPKAWIPRLRYPETLYSVYLGRIDSLSEGAVESAALDLARLQPPRGLSEHAFNECVALTLLQMPLIRKVDQFVQKPRRFGAVRQLIAKSVVQQPEFDPETAWQTLMRWLRHFLPERYSVSVPHHSEVFFRRSSVHEVGGSSSDT